jgi:Asp-tRNA(Asn)/Glu-tRNA(Gln) amidotransferase A subunit family amidase
MFHFFCLRRWLLLSLGLWLSAHVYGQSPAADAAAAARLFDLSFNDAELDSLSSQLEDHRRSYAQMRAQPLDNGVPPAFIFSPLPAGLVLPESQGPLAWQLPQNVALPTESDALAFYTVGQLAALLRQGDLTSVALTEFFLDRLKRYGDTLECVITLLEDRALAQARRADAELAAGQDRGPLHGIPFGVKDLFALPGYPTTWGAMPYKEQQREELATVIERLEAAGGVLVAKLTLGALAFGDVWYGGTTRNPWDLKQGSSGSSAGSAAATAAGLMPFAIGTETWGSLVSPSTRCGTTALRPTYGRVSRYGAMALSWTMDKVGPICRYAEDCAMVFAAIQGPDGKDLSLVDAPFNYPSEADLRSLRIGYLPALFKSNTYNRQNDSLTLASLRGLGAELIPLELPQGLPVEALQIILLAEGAAAFDELTRSNRDSLLVRQTRGAWPNIFRAARYIPAVEYIQATRHRYQLVQQMHAMMSEVDVLVAPSFGGNQLLMTNLTGHPCVVLPNGFDASGHPMSITFLGNLFDEGTLLAVAKLYQDVTSHEDRHPAFFGGESQP